MVRLHEAILYLCPDASFTFLEEDYGTIQWFNQDIEMPTIEAIEAAKVEVEKIKAVEAIEADYVSKIAVAKDSYFEAMILGEESLITTARNNYIQIKQELEEKKQAILG